MRVITRGELGMTTLERTFLNQHLEILELVVYSQRIQDSALVLQKQGLYKYFEERSKKKLFPQPRRPFGQLIEIFWRELAPDEEYAVCFTSNARVVDSIVFWSDYKKTTDSLNALQGAPIHNLSTALSNLNWGVAWEFEGYNQTITVVSPLRMPVPVC